MEGAHTHIHNPYSCKKGILRNPERRERARTHAFLIVLIRKYIKKPRGEGGSLPPYTHFLS